MVFFENKLFKNLIQRDATVLLSRLSYSCLYFFVLYSFPVFYKIPGFYNDFPVFLRQVLSLLSSPCGAMYAVRERGEGGSHGWR